MSGQAERIREDLSGAGVAMGHREGPVAVHFFWRSHPCSYNCTTEWDAKRDTSSGRIRG